MPSTTPPPESRRASSTTTAPQEPLHTRRTSANTTLPHATTLPRPTYISHSRRTSQVQAPLRNTVPRSGSTHSLSPPAPQPCIDAYETWMDLLVSLLQDGMMRKSQRDTKPKTNKHAAAKVADGIVFGVRKGVGKVAGAVESVVGAVVGGGGESGNKISPVSGGGAAGGGAGGTGNEATATSTTGGRVGPFAWFLTMTETGVAQVEVEAKIGGEDYVVVPVAEGEKSAATDGDTDTQEHTANTSQDNLVTASAPPDSHIATAAEFTSAPSYLQLPHSRTPSQTHTAVLSDTLANHTKTLSTAILTSLTTDILLLHTAILISPPPSTTSSLQQPPSYPLTSTHRIVTGTSTYTSSPLSKQEIKNKVWWKLRGWNGRVADKVLFGVEKKEGEGAFVTQEGEALRRRLRELAREV
ncbi:hypothetical protein HDV00_007099 [Rhizophlyctis rosea]|nr:hypothetical protein HDV00_007099 [Rhizophlyctis rosea]